MEKRVLFLCIHGLNSHLKCSFKNILEKKHQTFCLRGLSFLLSKRPYSKNFPCPKKISGYGPKAHEGICTFWQISAKKFWSRIYYSRNSLKESGNKCINRTSHAIYSKLIVYHFIKKIHDKLSTSRNFSSLLCG